MGKEDPRFFCLAPEPELLALHKAATFGSDRNVCMLSVAGQYSVQRSVDAVEGLQVTTIQEQQAGAPPVL